MSDVALKPCPFCGKPAEIERVGDKSRSTIYLCTFCGCSLETGEEWDHGGDWNRRVYTDSSVLEYARIVLAEIESRFADLGVLPENINPAAAFGTLRQLAKTPPTA